MRLLIVTQKVDKNDPILGFFHRWIEEFAKHCESIIVICLEKGEYNLPDNVRVLSLGKERNNFQFSIFNFQSILNLKIFKRIKYIFIFYHLLFTLRKQYDSVFVHMNQVYVILGFLIWKLSNKKIGLWYTHKNVSFSLKIATLMVDDVFTASEKSFRLKNKKVHVVGHGIDIDKFSPKELFTQDNKKLITVGRISRVKNIHIILEALGILKIKGIVMNLDIVGDTVKEDDINYLKYLKELINTLGLVNQVKFLGKFKNTEMPDLYRRSSIFVNLSDTGSLDKAILEAMSCGTKILTSNESFSFLSSEYFSSKDPVDVASHIEFLLHSEPSKLSELIKSEHNLTTLIPRIISFYNS